MKFTNSDKFLKAVNGYEKHESLGKLKWIDEHSMELANEVFGDTMNLMCEIASEYGVSYEDVLAEVRKVSRF